jgi:hypothetical protein
MEQISAIKNLLKTFPLWGDQPFLVDVKAAAPDSCALFPLGLQVLEQKEDVQGNRTYKLRQGFLLRRVACIGEPAAQWLMQLQAWLLTQPVSYLEPVFGSSLHLWAQSGHLTSGKQPGTGIYEVKIHVDYEKE